MELLPTLLIGLFNGWIPLVIYFIGLILSVLLYSKDSRNWLFNNPKDMKNKLIVSIRLFGQIAMLALIILLLFTPLKINNIVLLIGAIIFSIGFIMEMTALYNFRITAVGEPVVKGPYRFSRNPQWVGLFLVLLGSIIAVGIWLYLVILVTVGIIYHIQILDEEKACLNKYEDSYRNYMKRIPRYILFF